MECRHMAAVGGRRRNPACPVRELPKEQPIEPQVLADLDVKARKVSVAATMR